jgi:hypothetical protein
LEELGAVDSANLIRDFAVDAERVLSDRTDAHMIDLASGCGYSENANHDFVARVPVNVRNIPGPGNVMLGTGNCNCNFDMNMFLKNVENSVSKIMTEKEMVYHQKLEEMESRLRGVMAGMGTCSALWVATPVSNLAASGPVSSASDHFLSVRSRKLVASY